MKSFHNIEKSGFRPREYIGYAKSNGAPWRIRKDGCGGWESVPARDEISMYNEFRFKGKTLDDMSAKLDAM